MGEQINATCTVCGNGYHLCISCKDKIELSPWKMYTDTAEHFKIHQIIHGFSTKVYTKNEAKSKLQNVDLSDLETFKPNIKAIIEDILKEEPIVESVEKTEKPIEAKIAMEEKQVVEKAIAFHKKNYKVNNRAEAE